MWRWLFVLLAIVVAAATGGVAAADAISYTTYIEDFEDENGDPAFDPLFSHEFAPVPPWTELHWSFNRESVYPEHGRVLGLAGTTDMISFNLQSSNAIVYASVDFRGLEGSRVTFMGVEGEHEVRLGTHPQYHTVSISVEDVGFVTGIRLRGSEALFDNVTIRVIPEPGGVVLVVMAIAILAVKRIRHR